MAPKNHTLKVDSPLYPSLKIASWAAQFSFISISFNYGFIIFDEYFSNLYKKVIQTLKSLILHRPMSEKCLKLGVWDGHFSLLLD